jgi:hypothetical protein
VAGPVTAQAKSPNGANTLGGKSYTVWTESSMKRVMPKSRPARSAGQPKARISLAGGEYESFQVALLPASGHELHEVRIRVSDLVCEANGARIGSQHVEWQQVGYVWVGSLAERAIAPNAKVHPDAEVPGWWPDPLLPVESFEVKPDFAQSVWITVYAPPGTPAGTYTGAVTVSPKGEPTTKVEVQARVYGFNLAPGAGHFKTAFALFDDNIASVYGKKSLDAKTRRQWGDFVLRHRLNPDNIYRQQPPDVTDLEHYLKGGMNSFTVMSMPEKVTGIENCRKAISAFMERLGKSRDHEALRKMAFVYGFDEIDKDKFDAMRQVFGMARHEFGLPTMTTGHVPQDSQTLRDLQIDWLCPITDWLDFGKVERCRAEGFKVWSYCSLQPYPPFPNWRLDCPLVEARVMWWQAYHENLDGFLYWALNIWSRPNNDKPINPSDGPLLKWGVTTLPDYPWLHGDGLLLYPGVNGPMGSIRLANIRDGLEDYEYLWLLAQKRHGREAGRTACLPVAESLASYTRDPLRVDAQRDRIAREIED